MINSKKSLLLFTVYLCCYLGYSQHIIVSPYLQNASPNAIYIMWETDGENDGFVDWGNDAFTLTNTLTSSTFNSNGSNQIHTVHITGLTANTKYYYKVRTTSGNESNLYTFRTHPTKLSEASLNFVAMSDMQRDGSNPDVFETIVENGIIPVAIDNYTNGTDDIEAILIPGDLVATGSYTSWRNDFFTLSDSLTPYVPMYPVPGNHEYYGEGVSLYLDYFNLPLNGSASNPEEWWFKDISNVRIIGLNSNSPSNDLSAQMTWLDTILADAGTDVTVDFVFVQLHHPYKSELWTPGELDFTGEIIGQLETFSTTFGKPSIHFFGHTHAYSRGHSRDHNHLWVNVATAGGAIDNWGEFPNADYDEFVISEDKYGFVMLEVDAGDDPKFVLKRYSQGDSIMFEDNILSDEITIKRFDNAPSTPTGLSPIGDTSIGCLELKANAFDNSGNSHQATHWQIVEGCDFDSPEVIDIWKQATNWYNEINTQLNDDLTDEQLASVTANTDYCWRVRYRNNNLTWSGWSTPISFTPTPPNYVSTNLLQNGDAETGTSNWTGDIEALVSDECGSVPTYEGTNFFAVGGVCTNEQTTGIAYQDIDVSAYMSQIDAENYLVEYSGYLRSYAENNDLPEFYVECYDDNNILLETSAVVSNQLPQWLLTSGYMTIPSGTRTLRVILKGNRQIGTDNDSYYDALGIRLLESNCSTLSTTQNELESDIQLYPNPTADKLYYKSNNIFDTIVITDALGRAVLESNVIGKEGQIDVSTISEGIYIITFSEHHTKQSLRFIKNKE